MLRFIAQRLGAALVLIVVVSFVAFVLTWFSPGDPALAILGQAASPAALAAKRAELGLDRNVFEAYFAWARHALTGDLGTSWFSNRPVSESIATRLPVTITIAVTAVVLSGVLGAAIGLWAAARRGAVDNAIRPLSVLGYAIPNFIVAILLVTIFAIDLRVLPATGWVDFSTDPGGWLRSIILPVAALSLAAVAAVAQQMRNAAIATLQQDYVRTLRGRGLGGASIYLKHVLRNSAPVALTVLSLQFIGLLSGAVVIEYVFGLPGIGALSVGAAVQQDQPVIQGVVVTVVIVVVVVNLLVDLAYTWLNPKVRS
ncbi:MAG: ABC transporter permease [Microbacterium sp.]|uniref:ABC transporter permease n=1 Tax=Microbacterium sp. TaxID=51671 RepID=UPI001AD2D245|nr:ABC transporter permease [Microbacterium sp.]MBN9155279.1 ABC transporter permease [Microbacterium sp.]MBN9183202.1 ABC transporter permease [Microbacterium sp.]MBN9194643.1 ABC transporter permease [Microbacterium sp.]